jgi:hypothetical protein
MVMTDADKLEILRQLVTVNADRIRTLGEWPDWIQSSTLLDRIPTYEQPASGFDAGIACALDLIPRNKQYLSAKLHAHYTPDAVQQVRHELQAENFIDSETAWWLLACSFCREGGVSATDFVAQVHAFEDKARADVSSRLITAMTEYERMCESYTVVDGIAIALRDGGMQAAYLGGYDLAIQPMHGTWFLGTYQESLGIPEDFPWGSKADEQGRALSGPVHGSKQFVKCATFEELNRALEQIRCEFCRDERTGHVNQARC